MAGGSGWVYTEEAFETWETGNPTDSSQYKLESEYYLEDAYTIAGDSSFLSPNGETETGHSGNGFARITCTASVNSEGSSIIQLAGKISEMKNKATELSAKLKLRGEIDYSKSKFVFTNSANELGTDNESLYSDGNLSIDSNIVKKEKPIGEYYLHVLLVGLTGEKREIISSNSVLSKEEYDFEYIGEPEEYELSPGVYKLEVWGAQGGYRSDQQYGGKGGYSTGIITLNKSTSINVYVGGSGNQGGTSGGFNGGGSHSTYNGGGGASDIRIDSTSLYSRVIVAGGGGSCGASSKNGMYGGGSTGGTATQSCGSGGGGGTQTSGGTGGNSNSGTFGQGGEGKYYASGYAGAGGRWLVRWWR